MNNIAYKNDKVNKISIKFDKNIIIDIYVVFDICYNFLRGDFMKKISELEAPALAGVVRESKIQYTP